jgi:hypothetical protein
MVATFSSYATIEEAWGEPTPKKKKKAFDDIFESFADEMSAAPFATNPGIREVAAPIPAPMLLPEREPDEVQCTAHDQTVKHPPRPTDVSEGRYLNFAMYVFSGVILIFVMEQFVQIGMAMRGSR